MIKLTDTQVRILEFIRHSADREGRPPTIREIAAHFGMASTHGVRRHLKALEKKGYIERAAGLSRGIRLSARAAERRGIPIVGRVAAGTPILAEENIEGYLSTDTLFPNNGTLFCLQVHGDSMGGKGILDGDYVVVRRKPAFQDGEIAVAIIDGEATVKTLRRRGQTVELIPAGNNYKKMTVDLAHRDFRYAGEVIGILRTLRRAGGA